MNTISSNSTASVMSSMVNNISTDIISKSDEDSSNSLTIEELGIDEDQFSTLDSDNDGLVTQEEIASAIDTKLSEYNEMPSPEQFSSLLSDLGLEMPPPPEQNSASNNSDSTSDFVSQLISGYDTDGDSLLSSDEASILSEDEFNALDTDGDGSISAEELTSAIETVMSTDSSKNVASSGGSNSTNSSSSSDEEDYDVMDTNEDGVVSQAEKDAYYGITSDTDSDSSDTSSSENAQNAIKLLLDTIKANSSDSEDTNIDLKNFENIMKLANNLNDNTDLNTYLQNLSDKSSSNVSYA